MVVFLKQDWSALATELALRSMEVAVALPLSKPASGILQQTAPLAFLNTLAVFSATNSAQQMLPAMPVALLPTTVSASMVSVTARLDSVALRATSFPVPQTALPVQQDSTAQLAPKNAQVVLRRLATVMALATPRNLPPPANAPATAATPALPAPSRAPSSQATFVANKERATAYLVSVTATLLSVVSPVSLAVLSPVLLRIKSAVGMDYAWMDPLELPPPVSAMLAGPPPTALSSVLQRHTTSNALAMALALKQQQLALATNSGVATTSVLLAILTIKAQLAPLLAALCPLSMASAAAATAPATL